MGKLSDVPGGTEGRYLRAKDLPANFSRLMTIQRIEVEDVGGEQKAVMYFHGAQQGLPLNNTRRGWLEATFGDLELSEYAGKQLVLERDVTDFRGDMVPTLIFRRLPASGKTETPAATTKTSIPPESEMPPEDEIPF